ncbi:Deoxyadenosine kinase / Deoxyguanosine kinase [Clostridium bornimense]|uniref:Deoxyadenosine kinase / Deoxyguanosine kinase n=1 Tax=Clostridium bornimense TaxID=1216932 RepID=W6S0B8_9CLOT|nr:deoxynucleoside kinase [Clostridium bornimense]CDM69304.1 Deoxyadenosine kinase / Deoxyguanosine kinase [Clostridium bornimense]
MRYKEYLKKIEGKESWPMIVVDGVVGVGKTTLMNILVEELGYTAFLEPVVDNPILDKFYYDRKRYSFPLQIFFLNNRFRAIKEASLIDKAVLDRSIYGDLIFAKLLMENNEMDEEEYNIYTDLFENMAEHLCPPKLMIYLETSVDDAIKKINKRGREYEKVVEKDYWLRLNEQYAEYFRDYNISPLLKINVDNLDFENNPKDREYVLNLIREALK